MSARGFAPHLRRGQARARVPAVRRCRCAAQFRFEQIEPGAEPFEISPQADGIVGHAQGRVSGRVWVAVAREETRPSSSAPRSECTGRNARRSSDISALSVAPPRWKRPRTSRALIVPCRSGSGLQGRRARRAGRPTTRPNAKCAWSLPESSPASGSRATSAAIWRSARPCFSLRGSGAGRSN